MTVAYVALGANLGDPRSQLLAALADLERLPDTRLAARSSLYRSAPVGYADQPDFLNAVAKIETRLAAAELLAHLQAIERGHGRVRTFRDAPRTLDLDLLLYGNEQIVTPALTVPHPRLHERAFVLAPLLELDAAITIPGRGSAAELLRACATPVLERIAP